MPITKCKEPIKLKNLMWSTVDGKFIGHNHNLKTKVRYQLSCMVCDDFLLPTGELLLRILLHLIPHLHYTYISYWQLRIFYIVNFIYYWCFVTCYLYQKEFRADAKVTDSWWDASFVSPNKNLNYTMLLVIQLDTHLYLLSIIIFYVIFRLRRFLLQQIIKCGNRFPCYCCFVKLMTTPWLVIICC